MTKLVAVILYSAGLILALVVAIIGFWPELEATLFDPSTSADQSLNTLRCPMVITPSDTATISAIFTNPLERPIQFLVRTHISQEYSTLLREFNHKVALEVGESEQLVWEISVDDAVYNRLVFARVRSLRSSQIPSREQTCGILVVTVPGLTGGEIVAGLLIISLFGLVSGSVLWVRIAWPLEGQNREIAIGFGILTALVVLSSILSIWGFWALSMGMFVIIVLTFIGIFEHFFA